MMLETMPPPIQTRAESDSVCKRLFKKRIIWISSLFILPGVTIAVLLYPVYFTKHFYTVVPGQVYRGRHPTLVQLTAIKKEYGVKTVINLRGDNPWLGWHKLQSAHLKKLNINFESLNFSAERLPFATEVRRLIKVFDTAERPFYMHCHRGVDRTGFAATIYLLLHTGSSVDEARRQLSWRYGHLPFGKPTRLGVFFDEYESWLAKLNATHSNKRFRNWALKEYQANWSCEPLQFVGGRPKWLNVHEPTTFRIRTRNNGKKTWPLRPTRKAGVHLWYQLANRTDGQFFKGRAGLVHKDVARGESIEFTVVVPPVRRAGRYTFYADLIDEIEGNFYVIGSPILELEIEAREDVGANRN